MNDKNDKIKEDKKKRRGLTRGGVKGMKRDGGNLTLLYGYGGFNISLTPYFSSNRLVFMKAFNAVYAIPNIRGGFLFIIIIIDKERVIRGGE